MQPGSKIEIGGRFGTVLHSGQRFAKVIWSDGEVSMVKTAADPLDWRPVQTPAFVQEIGIYRPEAEVIETFEADSPWGRLTIDHTREGGADEWYAYDPDGESLDIYGFESLLEAKKAVERHLDELSAI